MGASSARRPLGLRRRWYGGGVAALLTAVLVFTGFGSPAMAAVAPPADSAESAASVPPEQNPAPAPDAPPAPEEPAPSPAPAPDPAPPAPVPAPVEEPAAPTAEPVPPQDGATPAPTPTAAPTPVEPEPTDEPADVGVLAVPAPGATTSVITVKVGSDRAGITGVTNLAGVVLLLNEGGAGGPNGTRPDGVAGTADGWAKCTSDAAGDCSFIVPETGLGLFNIPQANRDDRYWVVQAGVPDGYYANPSLRTGPGSGGGTATAYQFRTGTQLRAGNVYSSQNASDFMLSSGSQATASGGIWQQSRNNAALDVSCGLDVALILDLSGSVGSSTGQLKAAADAFVDSLQGTPSRMSLFSFSTVTPAEGANANFPSLTSVATATQADAFKSRYAGWTAVGGTNWDRGLGVAAAANTAANNFDLAVIITDGDPTLYNQPYQGPGNFNRFRETENGIFSANALKAGPAGGSPTRLIAFGVGDGASGAATALNLRAISGPTAYDGSNGTSADYYQTANYAAVGTALRSLALGNCEGALTVTKQIVPQSAPAGSIEGATPAGAGWQFTSEIGTTGVTTPEPVQTTTADGTGTVSYQLDFPGGTPDASVTVTEAQQPGFTLQPVDDQNAVCTNLNTGDPVVPTASPTDGFTVTVPSTQAVNCIVYNRAPSPEADLTVTKNWVVNGVSYEEGAQPGGLSALLQLTGPGDAEATDQGWGVTRTGYAQGEAATISEQVTLIDDTLCTDAAAVTSLNGAAVDIPLDTGYELTLSQAENTATITNTVTCESRLTLAKEVDGGDADPTSWTLNASFLAGAPVDEGLPGFSGVDGAAGTTSQPVTPNARYQLFETGGDARYLQVDERTDLQSNPLSTGSATCIRVDENGDRYPDSGYSDGINGGVNVPLGYRVECTFVNQDAQLTLLKTVVDDDGGSATPDQWELTATPATLEGLSPTTVAGSEEVSAASIIQVRPDHVYTLTESTVPGYEFSRLQRRVGEEWVDVEANPDPAGYPRQNADGDWEITVPALGGPVYRFVNDDVAPTLTLVKEVVRDSGGTADETDWTLTATTPDGPNLSGPTGTSGELTAGVAYTIGETGPDGYDWTDLTCTGYPDTTRAAPELTLQPGDDVTCTLTNDDVIVPVTIEKSDGAAAQSADGIWTIRYPVVVTNTSTTLPTTYSLTDVPGFDASFTVLTQGWEGAPDVTDVPLEAGGTDEYTYVITAEVNRTPVDASALECSTTGGGFFNTAEATYPGGEATDTGCAVPAAPTVEKIAQPTVQNLTTGEWTLSYRVAVANPSQIELAYELSDIAGPLPAGVTGGQWTASDPVAVGGGTFVRSADPVGDGPLATGTLPAGATHTYTLSRTVTVAASVTDAALTCGTVVGEGGGVWNTATVTNGIAEPTSSDCAEIERPDAGVTKTVTSTVQLTDGTWQVTYDIAVTNPSDALVAVYSLADALQFGGDITVEGATWTGPTGTGDFTADGTATLATDRALAPGTTETYTVVARAGVDAAAWEGGDLACDGTTAGGFLNTATLTVAGDEVPASDCSEPALPTIEKVGVAVTQDPDAPTRWTVTYDLTVTSGGYDTFYSLGDSPSFPEGVTLGAGTAQRTDTEAQPLLPVTPGADFVTGVALAAGATHVYRVTWQVELTDAYSEDDAACTGEPGSGFFNAALLQVGSIPIDATDCIPVDERVYPSVAKTVTTTEQDPATGLWTIEYDLQVTLPPLGEDNPKGLSAAYDLTDTLDFGDGIDIRSASWSGQSSGDFTFSPEPAVLASGTAIAAGATHTYTVRVVAAVTAAAVEGGTTACLPDAAGGFLNTAQLTSATVETDVRACAEPVFPEVEKTAVGEAVLDPDTGLWSVAYDVAVRYPTTTADPLPTLAYVLTDAPDLPEGVEVAGEWTAEAATTDTPAPDQPSWDGTGTWTIVSGTFDPAADGVREHLFTITAQVRVTTTPTGEPVQCDDVEGPGVAIANTATVVSGGYRADDDACELVPFDDVGIDKTTDGVDGPLEAGDTFDYVLTVTNNGIVDATDVRVADPVPSRLTVTAIDLSAAPGWSNENAPALVDDGNVVALRAATLPAGGSVAIRLSVTVNALPAPDVVALGPDDPAPTPELPESRLVNEACVTAVGDSDPSNDCDDVTVQTRDIAAAVFTRCVTDVPSIGFTLVKTDDLVAEPVELSWTPDGASSATDPASVERSYPGGSTTHADEFAWVGVGETAAGIGIDNAGLRPLRASDYAPGGGYYLPGTTTVMTPEQQAQFVVNGQILDPGETDFAWRGPTTLTLTVNPVLTFQIAEMPAGGDCTAARHSEVRIEKTASLERTAPGGAFTYRLEAANVSTDSAAEGVVVTDPIPTGIRVTDVTWPGKGDADAFPNWRTCAVTGQNSAGYGGTLRCELFGPLHPVGSGLGASGAPPITLSATVDPGAGSTTIRNVAVVDSHTFGDPGDAGRDSDDAGVRVSLLPPTGGGPLAAL
ncbi:VWA domain-containing protein, partial [Microbacterium lushaniae]